MEVVNLKDHYKKYTLTKNKFAINFIKKVLAKVFFVSL